MVLMHRRNNLNLNFVGYVGLGCVIYVWFTVYVVEMKKIRR